jgi:serine/threonine-protein kinase
VRNAAVFSMTPFGRYQLVRKLATGGMAEVFLARADGPMGFQKKCVLKRILPHFTDDPSFVQMFLAEARLAAELNHPNLVQIFDFGEVDGQYFIAMEYIDGPNLRVLNREVRQASGPMRLTIAARIITLAAEGLHFAHELKDESGRPVELVHRDISPDNVLVSRGGGVKVVDFGIAKAANQPHLTKSGMIKGKLAYMPPEQLAREPLDRRADLYALGVVLYELVSGEMPFDASSEVSIIQAVMGQEPLRRVNSRRGDVPPELDAIVARCLEKDPERRYRTCRELQGDLERFIQASGDVVGAGEIAALIDHAFPAELESAFSQVPSSPGTGDGSNPALDATMPRAKSASRPSVTALRPVPDAQTEPASTAPSRTGASREPRGRTDGLTASGQPTASTVAPSSPAPSRVPLVIGVLCAVALGGAVTYGVLKANDLPVKPLAGSLDAGPALPKIFPTPISLPVPDDLRPEVRDAAVLAPVDEALDAGQGSPVDAGAPAPVVPVHVTPPVTAHQTGTLELRIRPYATVTIDGRPVGDTPLPVQVLSVGHHKVRLVNPTLGKDVLLDVQIRPGENTLKHNFKE